MDITQKMACVSANSLIHLCPEPECILKEVPNDGVRKSWQRIAVLSPNRATSIPLWPGSFGLMGSERSHYLKQCLVLVLGLVFRLMLDVILTFVALLHGLILIFLVVDALLLQSLPKRLGNIFREHTV